MTTDPAAVNAARERLTKARESTEAMVRVYGDRPVGLTILNMMDNDRAILADAYLALLARPVPDAVREVVREAIGAGRGLDIDSPNEWPHIDAPVVKQFAARLAPYLADVRPDDDESVDEAWLKSVSHGLRAGVGYLLGDDFSTMNSSEGWHLMMRMVDEEGHESDPMRLIAIPTREQARGLCKYLGIELVERQEG